MKIANNANVTIFALPKSFEGHIGLIQRNAIQSWTRMNPQCEIILCGDDRGTEETASELGLNHLPHIARNKQGTPLVNDLFEKAEDSAKNDILAYVNADIILFSDFTNAIERIFVDSTQNLMVGRRWNLDLERPLNFENSDWEQELRGELANEGELYVESAIDYFVFNRGLFTDIPAFAIGRTAWDNWLIYKGRQQKAVVVDATKCVVAIHQNHGYKNFNNIETMKKGEEGLQNQKLMDKGEYTLSDVSHILFPDALLYALGWRDLITHPRRIPSRYPILRKPMRYVSTVVKRLGIRKSHLNTSPATRKIGGGQN